MTTSRALPLFLALALLALVFLALSTPAARAADPVIVRVTTSGSTTWPCGDLANWSNPCGLQFALNFPPGSELWIAAGTYKPTTGTDRTATFHLRDGIALYGGFAGGETLRSQRNFTVNVTTLSGDIGLPGDDSDNSYHVVTGIGLTNTAALDGFTVTAGRADGPLGSWYDYGAGMYLDAASPTLSNVTFNDNWARLEGGGLYIYNSNPTLSNVTFVGNSSGDASNQGLGGGVHNSLGSPTLTNVTFQGNSNNGGGGGMFNYQGNPTLTNVIFMGNSGNGGGGMRNSQGSPILTNVIFSANSAIDGGGMDNTSGSPKLTNVTFISNTASSYGGGMRNDYSNPTLDGVSFISNTASTWGGGMSNEYGSPMLANVTFSGNSAYYGGGMHNYLNSSPTLTNTTFYENFAMTGGNGMHNEKSSDPTIRNVIFWNTTTSNPQIYNSSSTPIVSDSVVQGGYASGTHIITADPLLGALGNWGGATQTIPLLPGSSAIDSGNTCVAIDQRLKPRSGPCDIGAFESQGFTLTKTNGDNQSTPLNTVFPIPFRATVTSAYSEPVDGGIVTFTAPSSGASAIPVASTVTIATGEATQSLTANGMLGSYSVTANTAGAAAPVTFTLTNSPFYFRLPMVQR